MCGGLPKVCVVLCSGVSKVLGRIDKTKTTSMTINFV